MLLNSSPPQRVPARDPLDRTLTLSGFGVNTRGCYLAVISGTRVQLNELDERASPIWKL